jgi:xanthine dehydrogenase YagR molybdenum-binding subunit
MSIIGMPLTRIDGRQKVTGQARYAAEFNPPGLAHAVLVGASAGRGRVAALRTARALAAEGVLAVITHENAPRLAYGPHRGPIDPGFGERLHILQDAEIRFHGQPIAILVAATLEQAEHAATLLEVEYAAQPPAIELADTVEIIPQALDALHAERNRGDADAALAAATVRVDDTCFIARETHNPMEPHATVAQWEGGRLTLWSKSQFVVNEQWEIAAIFGLPPADVTVICPFIGGAFGTSLRTWPHVTAAAIAARQVGRPVKLVLTRRQMFHATGHRPRTWQRIAIGADREGRFQAMIQEGVGETSRYEEYVEALTSTVPMMYSCPNIRTRYRLAPLDVATPTYMRGPGEVSAMHALETAIDELAVKLGMDPVELRLRNEPLLDESTGLPFSSRSLAACLREGAERFGWRQRDARPGSMRDGRLLVGYGVASATYPCLRSPASARVRLLPDGSAEVEAAASDMGPGTYTSMTQVAAETLGLPMERVRFALGRSDFPPTPPHGGSQTMASVGSAIAEACRMAMAARAEAAPAATVEAEASSARGEEGRAFSMHAFGAVFVEVTVDPTLAEARVRRALGTYGAGRIVNPRLARSQCIGGMVGGIGMALMEQTVLDRRDGRPVNASLAEYLLPVAADIGQIEAHFVEEQDAQVNPLGVKGLGEIAIVGMAPAIGNAIFHATGRRIRDLPIHLEHLL